MQRNNILTLVAILLTALVPTVANAQYTVIDIDFNTHKVDTVAVIDKTGIHIENENIQDEGNAQFAFPDTTVDEVVLTENELMWQRWNAAAADSWEYKLRDRMKPIVSTAKKSRFSTGICVYDLTGDSLMFEYHSQQNFRPASNEKLLTSIAALDIIGKEAPLKTACYVDGRITNDQIMVITERVEMVDRYSPLLDQVVPTETVVADTTYEYRHVLHGNIYVKGTFDPLFTVEDLNDMAREVGMLDFDELDGELLGDISMKDSLVFGSGWCWDDMPSSYVPWLSPLLFNEGIQLRSKTGNYMSKPDTYFLNCLAGELRARGKEIPEDRIRLSFQPTQAEKGYCVYSKIHTLADLLPRMMKKSNNQFAEAMFYLLAYNNGQIGHPVTADDCQASIKQVMEKAGCKDIDATVIADGSGLSLYNRVTPENIVYLLRYAFANQHIFDPLYETLPIAGVDGTIQGRMKAKPAYNNVRAKTGTVNGVTTLSGYLKASNGNWLAFSIMNNGVNDKAASRAFQDRICQALAK